ncbi:MAG: type IV secretory system conjugative DNA transfer family protein [Eubacterium sp.]|nr:type IV secretory system conjugative DNA transfer family protein [Eubacterium sp.]
MGCKSINNDLIIGSSGCGKTGGYVVPNLQNLDGSIVVSDTKGQLYKMFSKELKSKGYKVYTLDLVNPEKSCGYNPLKGIRRYKNGKYREQDVLTLANNIVPTLDITEPFWEQAAAGYLAFLITFYLETLPVEEQNMVSVCGLHTRFIKPNGRLSFIQWVETHPNTFAAKKYAKTCSAMIAERMWPSIVEFANRALEPFDFEEARTIFKNPVSFDISKLGTEKTALFLNVSNTDRTFDNLINVFYTQALQILCSLADSNPGGHLKVPVSLILQSMTQLDSMYSSAEATTIVNNCDHIIYLGSQDLKTAEFIGNRIFKTPDEVLCIPRDKAVVITTGEKAVIAEKIQRTFNILRTFV